MLLCTYQPLEFKFDTRQEFNEHDCEFRDDLQNKVGVDYFKDYKMLLGSNSKPVFCFKLNNSIEDTLARSFFVGCSCPEQFIVFKADNAVCYNDLMWNAKYGRKQISSKEIKELTEDIKYRESAYVVDQIRAKDVVFERALNDVLFTEGIYDILKLSGNKKAIFENEIIPRYHNGIKAFGTYFFKDLNHEDEKRTEIMCKSFNKMMFEFYFLPTILQNICCKNERKIITIDIARPVMPMVSHDFVPVVMFINLINVMICSFDPENYLKVETVYKNIYKCIKEMFLPIEKQNDKHRPKSNFDNEYVKFVNEKINTISIVRKHKCI